MSKMLKPYFAHGGEPHEEAVLVFAPNYRHAKSMAYRAFHTDVQFIDVRVSRIKDDCEHLRASNEPHVVNPPACKRCELWNTTPYIDGMCRDCFRDVRADERDDWDDSGEPEGCPACMGEGVVITCFDDMCANTGECIHGDGEAICAKCRGTGTV